MNRTDQYNEVIFSNRNKDYGAYVLRHNYRKYLFYAIIIAVSVFVFFAVLPFLMKHSESKDSMNSQYLSDVYISSPLDPIEKDPDVLPELQRLIAKAKFVVPQIVTNVDEETVQKTDDEAANADSSNNGTSVNGSSNGVLDGQGGSDDAIYTYVQEMPQFPGGDEAFNNFLRRNIRYPQLARQNSIQGRVYVYFVIEKNGTLSDIKVVQGIGAGCDEEALRVMRMMPRWKPGKKQGHEVRIQAQKTITFVLSNNTL